MCPNVNNPAINICPAKAYMHPVEEPCRFVKTYTDNRGWLYKIKSGIGGDMFKGFYRKPDREIDACWHAMNNLTWSKYFDEAQSDLNALAEKKGWNIV
jgi:hypothetical protein